MKTKITTLLALVALALTGASAATQPNILLIVSEDNGPELGCYGTPSVRTPTLDNLSKTGARFDRAYVPYSVCSPSRAAFLTGLYPHQNGQIGLATHKFAMYKYHPTIFSHLKGAGYTTALIGKLHVNPESAFQFDYRKITSANFGKGQRDMKKYAAAAGEFFNSAKDKPFFLSINYPDAHFPLHRQEHGLPEKPMTGKDVKTLPWVGVDSPRLREFTADYYNCLERLDCGVALLLEELKKAGKAESTLIIYIGDHGAQFSRGKCGVYEASMHIPLIVNWPGHVKPGTVATQLTSTIDILPTALKAAGLDIPKNLPGKPLQDLMNGGNEGGHKYIFGMTTGSAPGIHHIQFSIRDDRYRLVHTPFYTQENKFAKAYLTQHNPHFAAGTKPVEIAESSPKIREVYKTYLNPPEYELYDVEKDPNEFNDLANDPQHSDLKIKMIAALKEFQKTNHDPMSDPALLEAFEKSQQAATDMSYRKKKDFSWPYLSEFAEWIEERTPMPGKPTPKPELKNALPSTETSHNGFENTKTGPFTTLMTKTGVWSAEAGHAQIDSAHADLGKRCLHIIGGDNRAVELTLGSTKEGKLVFNAERWTKRTPFEFRVSARTDKRWKEIYNGDKAIATGGFQTKVSIQLPDGTDKLRFSCTAPKSAGILIDDVRIQEPAPMKVQAVTTDQVVTPVLVRNEADPLLQIQVSAAGNLQPIDVKKIQVGITGAELIESISIKHAGTGKEFAPAKPATEKMIFTGDMKLEEGENIFLVNAKLKKNADIDKTVDAACESVMLSNGKVIKPQTISPAGEKRLGVALRKAGDDGCVRYRIPGMDVTPQGTLIAVYDCRWTRGGDLPGNIDVGMSRSTDGGKSWEPMKVIMDMGDDSNWHYDGIGDPCILVDQKTGTIWVGATWSHGNRSWLGSGPGMKPEETGQYMLVKSEDDGKTWSKPINITSQVKKPEWCFVLASPGRGITMRDGTLVMPSQFQETPENKRMPYSTIIYSKDRGRTWKIGTGAKSNTTECRIVELTDGSLMLNMRDNRGGSRSIYTTKDLGQTWTEHPTSRKALPEPVCNACLISVKAEDTIAGKDMLIFCNPDSTRARHHMSLKVSFDDGMSWPPQYHMLLDAGNLAGYPSMALIDKETLGVLYEGSRANMTFQRIKIKDLLNHN